MKPSPSLANFIPALMLWGACPAEVRSPFEAYVIVRIVRAHFRANIWRIPIRAGYCWFPAGFGAREAALEK
jgi:hypothetical protein